MQRQKPLVRTILEPIGIAVALALLVRTALHVYYVPSRSMAPALEPGDTILVTPYLRSQPRHGDVIVFEAPANRNELLVKRVIAVAGDLVDSRLGHVRIGGHTIPEPYLATPASSGSIEAQIVPAGCYFVLGDNRAESLDSRSWGVVPRAHVVGRARMVLWSSRPRIGDVARASESRGASPATFQQPSSRLFKWIE